MLVKGEGEADKGEHGDVVRHTDDTHQPKRKGKLQNVLDLDHFAGLAITAFQNASSTLGVVQRKQSTKKKNKKKME